MSRAMAVLLFLLSLLAIAAEPARPPRTDLYGDPLPPGAVMRLGTIRLRHVDADVAFSKDGKQLLSCGCDGEMRVWSVATGKLVQRKHLAETPLHEDIEQVALSANGARAATRSRSGVVRVYDTRTGKNIGRYSTEDDDLAAMTFSANGQVLALIEADNRFALLRVLSSKDQFKRSRGLFTVEDTPIAVTADGQRVAAFDDEGQLRLWDAAADKELRREGGQLPECRALAFAPDGKTLAAGASNRVQVHLLQAAILKKKAVLSPPKRVKSGSIDSLVYSPDSRWLAGTYREDTGPLGSCGILLWDLTGAKQPRCLPERVRSGTRLVFAPDGATLACHDCDGQIRLWNVVSGQPLHSQAGHGEAVRALTVSPDGKVIASGDGGPTVYRWDSTTGKRLHALEGDHGGTHACLFSMDGRKMIPVGATGLIQIWDVVAGKQRRRIQMNWRPRAAIRLHAASLSLDGKRLAVVASGGAPDVTQLFVWDTATGRQQIRRPLRPLVGNCFVARFHSHLTAVQFHETLASDAGSVTSWRDSRVVFEGVVTGSLLATLPREARAPLFYSPDSRIVAAFRFRKGDGSDEAKGLSLIETATGEEALRLDLDAFPLTPSTQVAFTPGGRALVIINDKGLQVWDTLTGERLHQRTWPRTLRDASGQGKLCSLAVLPDRRAATGTTEGGILLWDLAPSTWPNPKPMAELSRKGLETLWLDLAKDAGKAHGALRTLAAASGQALPYLKERLRPVKVDEKRIEKLLTDLDSDSFEVREKATRELTRLHYRAESMMRQTLENKPSLEMRRRIEAILAKPRLPSAEDLRYLRAIAVLERIGTPEARRILEKLAGGAAAPETRAAQMALHRLK